MTTVLLIEDNPADVMLLAEELRDVPAAQALAFTSAPTLADALRLLTAGEGEVDLVLADLGLPDSDGRATITRLLEARPDVPVVALTGNDDDVAALAAVDAGAQDYIVKGTVGGSALARLIRHAIERHRLKAAQQRSLRFRDELLDFSQLALRDAPIGELHDEIADLLVTALPASHAGVVAMTDHEGPFDVVVWRSGTGGERPFDALPADLERALRTVAATAEPYSVGIRGGDDTDGGEPAVRAAPVARSVVAAPVVREAQVELVLVAVADGVAFDEDDRSFVTGLAYALTQALRRRSAESALNARMSELRLTIEQVPGILWTLDGELRVVSCTGAALDQLELDVEAITGARIDDVPGERALGGLIASAVRAFDGEPVTVEGTWHGRWWRTRCEPLRDRTGAIVGVNGLSLDITEEHRREAELAHRALHDTVTDLANRTLFNERLRHALELARRSGELVGVVVLDLDEFKQINDSLGHAAGDAVLVEVAHRLETTLRDSDTAARLGGDEFGVLLEGLTSVEAGQEVVDRVLTALRRPVHVEGRELVVTASVGLTASAGGQHAEALLRDADTAVYMAKAAGRNRQVLFEEHMHHTATRQLEMRTELAAALEQEALELHFQPAVELAHGAVTGAEALCRWTHPTLGAVPPGEFVPLAERTGLMVPLGWWVLRRACEQLARWQEQWPGFQLTVNVSDRQLLDGDFVTGLGALLERHRIRPGTLCLELDEASVADTERMLPLVGGLRELGVRLAVDDFGTNYSSFATLRQLGIEVVKIDRRFIRTIGDGPEEAAITRAILQLAATLQITVIAEGVEEPEQAELLRTWRCDAAQGWLWAPAMPPDAFEAWVDAERAPRGVMAP